MSKEKQIEEMAKVIANIPPIEFPFGSRLQGRRIYTSTKIAEHLYNAVYRKIVLCKECRHSAITSIDGKLYCFKEHKTVRCEDYCSYAEMKGGE